MRTKNECSSDLVVVTFVLFVFQTFFHLADDRIQQAILVAEHVHLEVGVGEHSRESLVVHQVRYRLLPHKSVVTIAIVVTIGNNDALNSYIL